MNTLKTITLTAAALVLVGPLTGCLAERPVNESAEPAWSYHDDNTQVSNNDQWSAWEAESTAFDGALTSTKSVESR